MAADPANQFKNISSSECLTNLCINPPNKIGIIVKNCIVANNINSAVNAFILRLF